MLFLLLFSLSSFSQVVSEKCSDQAQYAAISLIRLAVNHSPYAKLEFQQLGGVKLLQQVLRTSKAALTKPIADVSTFTCSYTCTCTC